MFQIARFVAKLCCAALALAVSLGSAWGDTVDGEWCSADGRRIEIEGANVTTPDGSKTIGNYDAHHYLFTMPPSEQNGGAKVDIVLVTDDTIHIRYIQESVGETALRPELWVRCKTTVSTLRIQSTRSYRWIDRQVRKITFLKASMRTDRQGLQQSWRLLNAPSSSGSRNDD